MLLPRETNGRQLPGDVSFATKSRALRAVLEDAGIAAQASDLQPRLDPVDLTRKGTDMTVLVSCWD